MAFSTHDASMGYFNSPLIDMIAVLFMFWPDQLSLHFIAFRHRSVRLLATRVPLLPVPDCTGQHLTVLGLYFTETYDRGRMPWSTDCFRRCRSVPLPASPPRSSTTGRASSRSCCCFQFRRWFVPGRPGRHQGDPPAAAGQTGLREIWAATGASERHIPVRMGTKSSSIRVVEAVWGFFALYVASFTVMYLAWRPPDPGPDDRVQRRGRQYQQRRSGPRRVGAHYAEMHDPGKWILCFAMLLGRLEIFTLLVLLTPAFWRNEPRLPGGLSPVTGADGGCLRSCWCWSFTAGLAGCASGLPDERPNVRGATDCQRTGRRRSAWQMDGTDWSPSAVASGVEPTPSRRHSA